MFLNTLSHEEKTAFLALSKLVISADDHVAPQEQQYYALVCIEMGLPVDTPLPRATQDQLLALFKSRRSKVIAILELMGVAFVDDSYGSAEHALIKELAKSFGMGAEDLQRMEGWVSRQKALLGEAAALWGGADPNKI